MRCTTIANCAVERLTYASGRGWAALGTAGRLVGHVFMDKGDASGSIKGNPSAERE
jgi:hypothetical protein